MRSFALLLSTALAFPSTGFAMEPVSVDIETSNLDRDGPTLEKQLRQRVTAALVEAGMTVEPGARERRLRIRVHRNEVFGYEFEVGTVVDGEVIPSGVEPFVCDPCRVLDLYERVEGTIPAAVAAIRQHEAPAPVPAEQVDETTTSTPDDSGEPPTEAPVVVDDERKPRVLGATGIVGIVVGAAGFGVLVFGASRINLPTKEQRSPEADEIVRYEDVTTQGWAWFGIGMAGLAAGATMLAVDLTVLRRQRARRVSVSPEVGRGTAGLVLRGRF